MASKPEMVEIDPLKVFLQAVENAKPVIGVKSIRRAGRVYQVSGNIVSQEIFKTSYSEVFCLFPLLLPFFLTFFVPSSLSLPSFPVL